MYDISIVPFIVDGVYVPLFLDKMKNLRICFHNAYWSLVTFIVQKWKALGRGTVWQVIFLFEKFFKRYVKNLR